MSRIARLETISDTCACFVRLTAGAGEFGRGQTATCNAATGHAGQGFAAQSGNLAPPPGRL
jgi:hypothetical protein